MKTILYLHAGAEMYGADKILLELVTGLDKTKFRPIVVLPTDGVLREKLESAGIKVHVISYPILRRKYFNPKGIVNYLSSYQSKSNAIVDYSCKYFSCSRRNSAEEKTSCTINLAYS